MSRMISTVQGFQYSVNIGYDLNNDDKLINYIPTNSSLNLLEEILLSIRNSSTERSRILIGAYGSGKSHNMLIVLSILMKKDLSLLKKALPKISRNKKLYQYIQNYYESDTKILPVIISGSNTSLSQAFLLGLQRTLRDNKLIDIMPETNYKAAIVTIKMWKEKFADTYEKLIELVDIPINRFISNLEDYDIETYKKFENLYPSLTSGNVFNPFLGFDIVEIYENVIESLKGRGYTGIYVVYDEFSKYLETNIVEASVSDTKMLQDFAEKSNRSGENQLHLMLISHKDISNYIEKLPKNKVDGWRGISERFLHIRLNNNYLQKYEIIASVIEKNESKWRVFCEKYDKNFDDLLKKYRRHTIYHDLSEEELKKVIYLCYPLHPVSTFILPRLSEKIAQNERTLFTFLSANGTNTLSAFLERYKDDKFITITPDIIFDYFEPLLKKEVYSDDVYKKYRLTSFILEKLKADSLESKIVKTLALIYILEQFERLEPTKDELVGVLSISYTVKEIEEAIENLIDNKYVIYLKQYNNYLQLKQTSGINIKQKILDTIESQSNRFDVKTILNDLNLDNYLYPSRYNDEKEMIRYFSFQFIDEHEVTDNVDWNLKSENIYADGVIYAIIPNSQESIIDLKNNLVSSSISCKNIIFVLPKKYFKIIDIVKEFNAVSILREEAISINDQVLFNEYEVIYRDLYEVINSYINMYTHPEELKSTYIYMGKEKTIIRKATLSSLMSDICDSIFSKTPIINNEVINRDELTTITINSRNKIIAGLLRNNLEKNLGLTGFGQDVSIMRSTLLRTGVVVENNEGVKIQLKPEDIYINNMLGEIIDFIIETGRTGRKSFDVLYNKLISQENHIGLRKGVIPIYLAAVIHVYKNEVVIFDQHGEVPLNVDVIIEINTNPSDFFLAYLDWNPEKEEYIYNLEYIFKDYLIENEKGISSYEYIVSAMRRWYLSLPKYSKEFKKSMLGIEAKSTYQKIIKLLKQNHGGHTLLFDKLPKAFGYSDKKYIRLSEIIKEARDYYDGLLIQLKDALIKEVKRLFVLPNNIKHLERMSLTSIIKDWCETLD